MGSSKLIIGDGVTDQPTQTVAACRTPILTALRFTIEIDRVLVTQHGASDRSEGCGRAYHGGRGKHRKGPQSSYKVSSKPSPAGEAPVEILFVPAANPPVAYVTNMFGGTLWTATWNVQTKDFDVAQAFDFGTVLWASVPLEIYFNGKSDRLYVTTAKPGHLHVLDLSKNAAKPELLKSIPTAEGAHHVSLLPKMKNWRFVQNSLLNLPGMSDGSITIVDLTKGEVHISNRHFEGSGLQPELHRSVAAVESPGRALVV